MVCPPWNTSLPPVPIHPHVLRRPPHRHDIDRPIAIEVPRRQVLHRDATLIQTFEPQLTPQQQQVLDLLGLPHSAYTQPAQSTR